MILRCTKKVLDVLGTRPVSDVPPDGDDWYANLLTFDRRRCLLLTHANTLFSVFEPDVRAARLRATRDLVADLIVRELAAEGLQPNLFGHLAADEVVIAKTADRSVLGCMNDMAYLCGHSITAAGGLALVDISSVNRNLRLNINSARDYTPPIDLARQRSLNSDDLE